jgi:hypothetical protein
VTLTDANGDAITLPVRSDGTSVYTFGAAAAYTVTLTATEDTTVSRGFCAMRMGKAAFRTDAIDVQGGGDFTFVLDVGAAGLTVVFDPAWGLPANVDVTAGGTLAVDAP